MKKLHVALVGSHPLPGEPAKGGVQRVVQVLRQGLAEKVHVSIVVPDAPRNLRFGDENGEIVYLKHPPGPRILSYCSWCSIRAYREIERLSPDLVHVQDLAGFTRLWPKHSFRPWVFTPHGVSEKETMLQAGGKHLRSLTASLRARMIAAIERTSRRRYEAIVAINPYILEAMPDVVAARHYLIPNPVDDVFIDTPRVSAPREVGPQLLYVGVISPRKNILGLIDIMRELVHMGVNARLHVLGPIVDTTYFQTCEGRIRELDLAHAVTFHGVVEPQGLATWMDRTDALVLTSMQETAPMVVAEAHCRGLPVAAPRAFGLPFMIKEGHNGIFLDGPRPVDNADRITKLLVSDLDRESIRQDAMTIYHRHNVINNTLDVYREVSSRRVADDPRVTISNIAKFSD